ncbi:hypothetical protein HCAG_07198 [Histoplasma mississippiense (nom. inval.)]|uniref:hypothetical protein n=1 Tax=Ajellomyces capsulatus (strain NAm1 / WU24) TaxID=2059318 RepID=UPI000157CBA3|nr:hypothetical protein HCAG_07198 [Histoplasma mississippiense (nom. inval.)]EDN10737.1 hypothetical protein HCAG_07198 [Histoplasma mississippiense (nom. inval.)]
MVYFIHNTYIPIPGVLGNATSAAGPFMILEHVENLIGAGVKPEDVAVVTPYNAQLALLSSMLKDKYPGLELGSVDGFQGREKEAVIVSLVRSNPEHEVGFLAEKRRLNVAMTRPKRHLCICGDSETIRGGNQFLRRWDGFLGGKFGSAISRRWRIHAILKTGHRSEERICYIP